MIGSKMRRLREEKNVSQQKVATALGLSRQVYNNYELEKREPDYETIKKLAEYFGVSTDYLLDKTDIREPVNQLVVPEVLSDVAVGFHRGEFEGLTQSEIDALAVAATALKAQRKL